MKRTTIYIEQTIEDDVKKFADTKKWSVSKAISVLLEYAIKEKQRKKLTKKGNDS